MPKNKSLTAEHQWQEYPQSVAFPQTKITFRDLTEEEKQQLEKQQKQAEVKQKRLNRHLSLRK